MRKGELRRDSILNAAEELFVRKGYDETSIQDILDALSLSKGGFYHYFESKIQLLEEISARRAERDVARLRNEFVSTRLDNPRRLSLIFSAMQLMNGGDADFAAMALKVGYIDSDVNFRDKNRGFLLENLCPLAEVAVRDGAADGSFFVRNPQRIARILLLMACDANDECCRALAENPQSPDCAVEIMEIANAYRECMENLLGARFGSIVFCEPEPTADFVRQICEKFEGTEKQE